MFSRASVSASSASTPPPAASSGDPTTHAVFIYADRTQARLLRGWLVVGLELETDQTGRRTLELVLLPRRPAGR